MRVLASRDVVIVLLLQTDRLAPVGCARRAASDSFDLGLMLAQALRGPGRWLSLLGRR